MLAYYLGRVVYRRIHVEVQKDADKRSMDFSHCMLQQVGNLLNTVRITRINAIYG